MQLLDINCPVRSAILLYLLAVIFMILYKPKLTKKEYNLFLAPSVFFIAVISYFILTALSICV